MGNKVAVLVPNAGNETEYNDRIELIEKGRELIRYLRKKFGISFRLGIGGVKPLRQLVKSYREAVNALIASTGQVAHADDLPIGCDYEKDYPVDLEKGLLESVGRGDHSDATMYAESFVNWMKGYDGGNLMAIRLKILEFTLRAESMAYVIFGRVFLVFMGLVMARIRS